MTNTDKTTIHDLAWDFAEESLPHDKIKLIFALSLAGVDPTEDTIAYLGARIRIERAKRGIFGQVSL